MMITSSLFPSISPRSTSPCNIFNCQIKTFCTLRDFSLLLSKAYVIWLMGPTPHFNLELPKSGGHCQHLLIFSLLHGSGQHYLPLIILLAIWFYSLPWKSTNDYIFKIPEIICLFVSIHGAHPSLFITHLLFMLSLCHGKVLWDSICNSLVLH